MCRNGSNVCKWLLCSDNDRKLTAVSVLNTDAGNTSIAVLRIVRSIL